MSSTICFPPPRASSRPWAGSERREARRRKITWGEGGREGGREARARRRGRREGGREREREGEKAARKVNRKGGRREGGSIHSSYEIGKGGFGITVHEMVVGQGEEDKEGGRAGGREGERE